MPIPGIFPPPLPCETPVASVAAELHAALDAYAASPPDLARFYGSAARVSAGLGCLSGVLPREAVAQLYEVQAILAYVQKDPEVSTALLRGARAVGGTLPAKISANTPKLAELDRAAQAEGAAPTPVAPPPGLSLWVDGAASSSLPTDRPYLLQVLWADGAVHYTGLLPTGATPELSRLAPPVAPEPVLVQVPVESPPCPPLPATPRPRPAPGLVAGAIGSTATAAGLYALAALAKIEINDPTTPTSELGGLAARANTMQWGAIGVGAVAVGLDVTALIAAFREPER